MPLISQAVALRGVIVAKPANLIRVTGLVLAAASLAACAQSNVATRTSSFTPSTHQAALHRETPRVSVVRRQVPASDDVKPVSVVRRRAPASDDVAAAKPTSGGGGGVASFYSQGQMTANGEQFDPNELTAAHPTLPFGTKLRVTNTKTGRSVTVRVNDRGPYVPGRVVDVSYSAAQALGMVRSGTASVKLDVVQ
jgi:rare lipoprotein A